MRGHAKYGRAEGIYHQGYLCCGVSYVWKVGRSTEFYTVCCSDTCMVVSVLSSDCFWLSQPKNSWRFMIKSDTWVEKLGRGIDLVRDNILWPGLYVYLYVLLRRIYPYFGVVIFSGRKRVALDVD